MLPPVSVWAESGRLAVAAAALLAVLFAPAMDQGPTGLHRHPAEPVDARILAPTFGEAIVAVGPKLASRHHQVVEQRSRAEPLPPAIVSAIVAVLLLRASFAQGLPRGTGPRLSASRLKVPRGPPALQST
jgi:hypothetical protein